jgi:hypothetical protein
MVTKKNLFIRPFGKHEYEFNHEKAFSPLSKKNKDSEFCTNFFAKAKKK